MYFIESQVSEAPLSRLLVVWCVFHVRLYNNTVIHPATADFIECTGMYNGEVSRWAVVLFKRFGHRGESVLPLPTFAVAASQT